MKEIMSKIEIPQTALSPKEASEDGFLCIEVNKCIHTLTQMLKDDKIDDKVFVNDLEIILSITKYKEPERDKCSTCGRGVISSIYSITTVHANLTTFEAHHNQVFTTEEAAKAYVEEHVRLYRMETGFTWVENEETDLCPCYLSPVPDSPHFIIFQHEVK